MIHKISKSLSLKTHIDFPKKSNIYNPNNIFNVMIGFDQK